ncbi:hypothetical protein ACKKBG_A32240 [Auxenochlorella protothecoides x Auxenochlorella symbiontica]
MSITSDELLQNFFKTGSTVSLPRIDSESQFQEFMRKIPSATNLAAAMTEGTEAGGGEQAAPAGGVPRVPSLDFIKAFLTASRPAGDSAVNGSGSIFAPYTAGGGGAHPAPAFELNGSVALALGRAKLEAEDRGAGNNEGQPGSATCGPRSEGGSRGDTPTAHGRGLAASALTAPGLPQQPDFPSGNLQIAGLQGAGPHMVLNPNVLAAAFMQSQLGGIAFAAQQQAAAAAAAAQPAHAAAAADGSAGPAAQASGGGGGLGPSTSSEGGLALEPGSKQAVRRERRMLSNRESARRSRKRKQEHLSTMEARLAESERGREEALARCARLAEDLRRRDVELAALRADLLCRGGPDDGAAPAAEAGAGA